MKAGIAIEGWKLPIFSRHLKEAGYSYEESGTLTPGVILLTVQTSDVVALKTVILAATAECRGAPK